MAVTRINNNQITDASAGNAYVGVNAASKVQNYTITSQKIANNLTYGSDFTIAGNLTVQGTTTTIDTVNTLIQDPMITLADGQTSGTPTLDIGTIGLRGSQNSAVLAWKESALEFVTALSTTTVSNTTFTISSYANLHTGNFIAQGTSSLVGNVIGTNTNFTGNITNGNLITVGLATVTGNITGGNLLTAGIVSATGNLITGANLVASGYATVTGNITGGNLVTGGLATVTGNITGGNLLTGGQLVSTQTGSATQGAAQIFLNGSGNNRIDWNSNGTGAPAFTTRSAGAKLVLYPNIGAAAADYALGVDISTLWAGVPDTTGQFKWYAGTTQVGSLTGGGALSVTGNVTGANINTAGLISAVGNINGGNLYSAGTITSVGNITAPYFIGNIQGNIDAGGANTQIQFNDNDILAGSAGFTFDKTANLVTVAGNVQGGNLLTSGLASVGGNITGGANLSVTSTITGGNLATGGTASVTGNVTGGNLLTGGLVSATANVTGGNLITGGLITATANITGGNIVTGGQVSATGNITGGNVSATAFTGTTVSVTANITGGNLLTSGLISSTGNITGGNISGTLLTGTLTTAAQPNVTSVGTLTSLSVSGNITGGNVSATGGTFTTVAGTLTTAAQPNITSVGTLTSLTVSGNANIGNIGTVGLITATGNITGGNVNTSQVYGASGLTLKTGSGTLVLNPAGNIDASSKVINNLGYPVQDQDAASKIYVDTVAQGLDAKASVHTATAAALPAYTYNNGTSGVGATLTGTATGNLVVDGDVILSGQRVLVKNETGAFVNNTTMSAAFNGIYLCTTQGAPGVAYVLTRAVDFDVAAEMYSAFTFVETGDTTADTGWVCTNNVANPITVGTTQILWTQFSGAGSYTANTAAGLTLVGSVFNAKVDNNTTAFDGSGNIIVKAGANLTTPNIGAATGTSLSVTGNVTGGNINTGGIVSATGNLATGANLVASGYATVTGNITGGNLLTGGLISSTGAITGANITGANLLTGGLVSATGNLNTSAGVLATGNVTGGNINTAGQVVSTGTITGGNLVTGGFATVTGNVTGGNLITGGQAVVTGNLTGGNLLTAGIVSATGNLVTGANLVTSGYATVTGNITGGNVSTAGQVSATGNVTGGNLNTGGTINATGNVNGTGAVFSGNVTAQNFIGNISGNIDAGGANTNIQFNDGDILAGSAAFTFDKTSNAVVATGNITAGNANIVGTTASTSRTTGALKVAGGVGVVGDIYAGNSMVVDGGSYGNVTTTQFASVFGSGGGPNPYSIMQVRSSDGVSGLGMQAFTGSGTLYGNTNINFALATIRDKDIPASLVIKAYIDSTGLTVTGIANISGNITGGNISTAGLATVTGNVNTSAGVFATGNVTGGNINTPGLATVTGNISTGANLIVSGYATVTGNVTGGNLITGGLATVTGNITSAANIQGANVIGGNIVLTGNSINELNPGGTIAVNGAGANTNFSVSGLNPNVFFVNASTNTASFGNSRQITNAIVAFNSPTSILTPVGNTGQRPSTGETGMLRFNTTINNLEIFDNSAWATVGTPSFTVIADQQFTGNAVQTQFTLGSTQTTNSCIVSINGVLQIPNLAYSVSGTDPTCVLTFTEAPAAGDIIDVRQITTTTTVASISNSSGNAVIYANAVAANIDITGNMVTAGNVYGSYILGNGSQLTGIDATLIQNGNSTLSVVSSGGNIRANVAGATVETWSTSGVSVIGNVTASQGIVSGLQGYTNERTYSANLTYPTDTTRMLVGPMTVNTGVTVTVAGTGIVVIL